MDAMSCSLKTEHDGEHFMPRILTLASWCQPLFLSLQTPHTRPGTAATIPPPTLRHSKECSRKGDRLLPSHHEAEDCEFQLEALARAAIAFRLDYCQPITVWRPRDQAFR